MSEKSSKGFRTFSVQCEKRRGTLKKIKMLKTTTLRMSTLLTLHIKRRHPFITDYYVWLAKGQIEG